MDDSPTNLEMLRYLQERKRLAREQTAENGCCEMGTMEDGWCWEIRAYCPVWQQARRIAQQMEGRTS